MSLHMDYSHQRDMYEKVIAVIFKNNTIDSTIMHLDYKILVEKKVPQDIYNSHARSTQLDFRSGFVGLQLCLDESFIKIKAKNESLKIHVSIYFKTVYLMNSYKCFLYFL